MKYMMFVCTDPEGEAYRAELDTIGDWVSSMDSTGKRLIGERLKPSVEAQAVRVRGDRTLLSQGSVLDPDGRLAGFDILEASDLAEAQKIAAAHPMARFGRIELREFWPWEG